MSQHVVTEHWVCGGKHFVLETRQPLRRRRHFALVVLERNRHDAADPAQAIWYGAACGSFFTTGKTLGQLFARAMKKTGARGAPVPADALSHPLPVTKAIGQHIRTHLLVAYHPRWHLGDQVRIAYATSRNGVRSAS